MMILSDSKFLKSALIKFNYLMMMFKFNSFLRVKKLKQDIIISTFKFQEEASTNHFYLKYKLLISIIHATNKMLTCNHTAKRHFKNKILFKFMYKQIIYNLIQELTGNILNLF